MTTTFMTNLFLLIRAYFSFTYTYRIIPNCYDCIADAVFLISVQLIIQKCILCIYGGEEAVDTY